MDIRINIVIILAFLFSVENNIAQSIVTQNDNYDIIKLYLEDDLWGKRDVYDAGHYLMVPLHYSYKYNNQGLKSSFYLFFTRFISEYEKSFSKNSNNLQRLQFCYLVSQYLKLHLQYDSYKFSDLEIKLFEFLKKEAHYFWKEVTANNWKHSSFIKYKFIGFKDRINWKLNTKKLDETNFYRAIIDSERFLLAVAADLKYIIRKSNNISNTTSDIDEIDAIVAVGLRIYNQRVSKEKNEFIFQKGFWTKHRDYKYAGCESLRCIENGDNRVVNISEDTSHSLRMPLFLKSFEDGLDKAKDKKLFFALSNKLKSQLLKNVIKYKDSDSTCFYPTNYLDGSNGYFRYNYETHKNEGYGPFELSETFKIGWWAFLEDQQVSDLYVLINSNLESRNPCEFVFQDKTKRVRHPVIANRFTNNLYVVITKMASQLTINNK